jgi:hypothetical protein
MEADMSTSVDHFYTYGDVYETLEACDQLDMLLGRLRRQQLLSAGELMDSRRELASVRARVEHHMAESAVMPKFPQIP